MWHMGIDQNGDTYHDLKHPRKDLLDRLDRKHAKKMYIDKKDGTSKHIGYIIGRLWITIYVVTPWENDA